MCLIEFVNGYEKTIQMMLEIDGFHFVLLQEKSPRRASTCLLSVLLVDRCRYLKYYFC